MFCGESLPVPAAIPLREPINASEHEKRQQSLEAAFKYFNETSSFLAESYAALEQKVKGLSQELDNVSAAKEAEYKEKNALENKLNALLDFLPGGVIVLDARGKIVESNPAAKKLLNSELNGQIWRHVINDCFAPKNDDGLEVSTRGGRRVSIATSSLGVEGQIILLTDQTETRKLQENLGRHERLSAMGKMVSALAHQIRTPLSAALLYAGHLCHSDIDTEQRGQFSQKLYKRLQHMEKQVRDMLLFVKNELPLNDIASASELVSELKSACEVAIQSTGTHCTWHLSDGHLEAKCNKEALVSALSNLVNNAIQSKEGHSNIQIEVKKVLRNKSPYLLLTVCDDGDGMDQAALEKIEEPFATTKSTGTGLGLSVVRSIARAHSAKFYLKSAVGKGTCAYFELPTTGAINEVLR